MIREYVERLKASSISLDHNNIRGTRRRNTVPKVIVDKPELMNGDKIRRILFKDGSILITKVKRRVSK